MEKLFVDILIFLCVCIGLSVALIPFYKHINDDIKTADRHSLLPNNFGHVHRQSLNNAQKPAIKQSDFVNPIATFVISFTGLKLLLPI